VNPLPSHFMGGCSCAFPYCEPILSFIRRSSKKRRKSVGGTHLYISIGRGRAVWPSRLHTPGQPTGKRRYRVKAPPSPGFTGLHKRKPPQPRPLQCRGDARRGRQRVRLPPALPQCWTCPPIQAKLMGRHCHGCLPVRLVTSRVSDQFPRSSRSGRSVSWCVALSRSWQACKGATPIWRAGGKTG
jgi:hypothetical protein